MRTKADTRLIVERLKKEYPVSECSLAYDDAWQLLVSVRLSAQCTDARVNIVTKDLFAKYPTLEALAAAGPDAIEAIIKPCGLGKSKARDLAGMANMLLREYGGKVPQAMEACRAWAAKAPISSGAISSTCPPSWRTPTASAWQTASAS